MFTRYRENILRCMHDIQDTSAIYRVYTDNACYVRVALSRRPSVKVRRDMPSISTVDN